MGIFLVHCYRGCCKDGNLPCPLLSRVLQGWKSPLSTDIEGVARMDIFLVHCRLSRVLQGWKPSLSTAIEGVARMEIVLVHCYRGCCKDGNLPWALISRVLQGWTSCKSAGFTGAVFEGVLLRRRTRQHPLRERTNARRVHIQRHKTTVRERIHRYVLRCDLSYHWPIDRSTCLYRALYSVSNDTKTLGRHTFLLCKFWPATRPRLSETDWRVNNYSHITVKKWQWLKRFMFETSWCALLGDISMNPSVATVKVNKVKKNYSIVLIPVAIPSFLCTLIIVTMHLSTERNNISGWRKRPDKTELQTRYLKSITWPS